VAFLFVKLKDFYNVEPLFYPIYATTNGITVVLLIAAVIAIKKGKRRPTKH
jgi:putative membrane protein